MASPPSGSQEPSWLRGELAQLWREFGRLSDRIARVEVATGVLPEKAKPPAAEVKPAEQPFAVKPAEPKFAPPPKPLELPPVLAARLEEEEVDVPGLEPLAAPEVTVSKNFAAAAATATPPEPAGESRVPAMPAWKLPSVNWEETIGKHWMTWLGAFTLLLAVGFGVHWAWSTFHTPPWLQVLAIHLLGGGLIVGGHFLERRQLPPAARALAGLGIFTLYAAALAAQHLYKLWGQQTAFAECAAITAVAIALALRADSFEVVLLGALGGYLTPIITSAGSANYVGLFTYLAFLNVALVVCAVWRGWNFLKPLALAATATMFAGWMFGEHFDPQNSAMIWNLEWFAVLHGLIFLVGSTIPPLAWKRATQTADLVALAAGSFFFMGVTWLLFHERPGQQLALVSWRMSLLHAALFGLTYARVTNVDRMPRVHLALAAAFLTLAIPLQLDDALYWGTTWCIEGLTFMAVGVYFRDRQMCMTALVVFLIGGARLVIWDWNSAPRVIAHTDIDLRFAMFVTSGLLTMLAAGLYRLMPSVLRRTPWLEDFEQQTAALLWAVGAILLVMAPVLQLQDPIYLGPVWAAEALAFTAIGLIIRERQLCVTGLAISLIAATRLLLWDWKSPERTFADSNVDLRFTMFLIAGVLTMLAGGLYRIIPWLKRRGAPLEEPEQQIASTLSAIGALLVTMSPMLQLHDWVYLGPVWAVESLIFCILGLALRERQLSVTGLLVFAVAGLRLVCFDFLSPAATFRDWAIDVRAAAFLWVGLFALAVGATYRIVNWVRQERFVQDDYFALLPGALLILGAALVTCVPPLQLSDWAMLGPVWVTEALLFTVVALCLRDRLLTVIGVTILLVAAVRLPWDFADKPRLIEGTIWDARFVAIEVSGLLTIVAGACHWLIPKLLHRKIENEQRIIGGALLAAGNLALMAGLLCQWDTRIVLILWTLDTALIWAAGFWLDHLPTRAYALALALVMVGSRAIHDGYYLDDGYRLIFNSRFISLALVTALYLGAGWMYRKRSRGQKKLNEQLAALFETGVSRLDETLLDPVLGILGNLVLLFALSFEIHSWYAAAAAAGWTPFPDMHMAEMATYSIVWAVYAAIVVAAGFAMRYPLFRILGLLAFAPIVLKVFFLDLENLRWMPRVLALAVLGMMLLGVSMLYQKFSSRVVERA